MPSICTKKEYSFYGKAVRKRCVYSWHLKDDKDKLRQISKDSDFQMIGAWYWKDCAPVLFRLTLGMVKRFWEEEIWRMSKRTDSRRGKVIVCHQNIRMKKLPVWRQCILKQEVNGVSSREVWHGQDISNGSSVREDAWASKSSQKGIAAAISREAALVSKFSSCLYSKERTYGTYPAEF